MEIKGKERNHDAEVLHSHIEGLRRAAKQRHQWTGKDKADNHQDNTDDRSHRDAGTHAFMGLFGISPSGANAQERGRAISHAPRKGIGDADHRKRNTGGGIAQIPQLTVSDKDLIHNVIKCADKKSHHAGNGEFQQKL